MKKIDLNEVVHNSLLQMDADINFDQSDLSKVTDKRVQYEIRLSMLRSCKVGDKLYWIPLKKQYTFEKHNAYIQVGVCVGTSEETINGLPLFMLHESKKMKFLSSYDYDYDHLTYDNGWENTNIIKQVAKKGDVVEYYTSTYQMVGNHFPDLYIPSIGEIMIAYNNKCLDESSVKCMTYMSSSPGPIKGEFQYLYASRGGIGNQDYNAFTVSTTPFIRVTPDNLIVSSKSSMNESQLISFNDIEFDQSNQSDKVQDFVKKQSKVLIRDSAKCGDVLCYNEELDSYIIVKFDIYKENIVYNGHTYNKVGYCCASKDQTKDQTPRFCSDHKLPGTYEWSRVKREIQGLSAYGKYSGQELKEDFDGKYNTECIYSQLDDKSPAVWVTKNQNKHYYLPSAYEMDLIFSETSIPKMELIKILRNLPIDPIKIFISLFNVASDTSSISSFWTSNQVSDAHAIYYKINSSTLVNTGINAISKNIKSSILPFYDLDEANIEKYIDDQRSLNESALLQMDNEVAFDMSDQGELAHKNIKNTLCIERLKECKLNTPVWEVKPNKFIVGGRWSGFKVAGYCVATADQMVDGLPRFQASKAILPTTVFTFDGVIDGYYSEGSVSILKDIDGYEHTKNFIDNGVSNDALEKCKELGKYYYIPAIGELYEGMEDIDFIEVNDPYGDPFQAAAWSSTIMNEGRAAIIYPNGDLSSKHCSLLARIIPFLHVGPENMVFSYNESANLLTMDDDINFEQSELTKDTTKKYFYNFNNCQVGDKIYYDPVLGVNTSDGEYIGFCCISAGQLDNHARFAYKKIEFICQSQWYAEHACKKWMPEKHNIDCYLPSKDEVELAIKNANEQKTPKVISWDKIWTSTREDETYGYVYSPMEVWHHIVKTQRSETHDVWPFIKIDFRENTVNESTSLLSFDDNDIEFVQSNQSEVVHNKISYTIWKSSLQNIKIGQKIHWVKDKFYLLGENESLGGKKNVCECVISADQTEDGFPRFAGDIIVNEDGNAEGVQWSTAIYDKPNSVPQMSFSDALKDMNGYENSFRLSQHKHHAAARLCKRVCKDFYLPSCGEINQAYDNGEIQYGYEYWTSNHGSTYVYVFDNTGSIGYWDTNDKQDFGPVVLPFLKITHQNFISITYEKYKQLNHVQESALLSFDNDINFEQSNQIDVANKKVDYVLRLEEIKKAEVGYNVYERRGKYWMTPKHLGPAVAICVASADQMEDGMPRFAMWDVVRDGGDGLDTCWSSVTDYLPDGLPQKGWDDAEIDIDGYENSKLLNADGRCEAFNICKEKGNYFYLPAVGELKVANDNYMLDDFAYWSSTQRNEIYAYIWNKRNDSDDIYQADKKQFNDTYVLPFLHIEPMNFLFENEIHDKPVRESQLLQIGDEIQFDSQNLSQTINKSTKKHIKQMALANCKLGDVLYYNKKTKKFRAAKNENIQTIQHVERQRLIDFYGNSHELCVGICVIESYQIDDYPRFAIGPHYINYELSDYVQRLTEENKCIDGFPNYSVDRSNLDKWLENGEWIEDTDGYKNCQTIKQTGSNFIIRNDTVNIKGFNNFVYVPAIGELVALNKNKMFSNPDYISSSQSDGYWIKYKPTYKQTRIQLGRKDIPSFETLLFVHVDENNFEIGEK